MSQVTGHRQANLGTESNLPKPLTEETPFPLRAYQVEGVKFLLRSASALLADEMGLGKTVQTAVALRSVRQEYGRVLLITPTSLCLNWQREIEAWAPELAVRRVLGNTDDRAYTYRLPIQVLIASYEQMRTDSRRLQGYVHFDLVVIDEAQRIKNKDSETNLACRIIPRDRSWALTGTPLENHPSDLAAIFRFLKPRLLQGGMSRSQMHAAMAGHFLRRTKSDVLNELPPIISRKIRLELGSRQRQAYEQVWNARHEAVHGKEPKQMVTNMLAILTRLKQICNFDDESGESVKLDVVRSILEQVEATAGKVLIFSQYVKTLKRLSKRIGIPNEIFYGGLSPEERERMLEAFRKSQGPRALLLSLQSGGVGLNLQEASTVILFDRWWNPATEDQAVQRAHRFGRQVSLEVIRFLIEDTVEERIQEVLDEKRALFDEYVAFAPQFQREEIIPEQLKNILELR